MQPAGATPPPGPDAPAAPRGKYLLLLAVSALGVVYGDIGTSPLYALRECFHGEHAVAPTESNVLGVLSLVFWSLVIVISFKYLVFILRAHNRGEGGILALAALVTPVRAGDQPRGTSWVLLVLGLFGAALLYGDGVITPAISVLSAVEGLAVATEGGLKPYVLPITIAVLVGVFMVQSRGTGKVGVVFGPITLLWFLTMAALGLVEIVQHPGVLRAVSPLYAADFFARLRGLGFLVLGAVFLVVTGGEALYADMGHFGARPIRLTWYVLVLPSLLLNYFGQGALLINNPGDEAIAANPFYHLAPAWALYPLVALATAAAVIASQAVISGAFSLTRQAVQLGYSPRLDIEHTSSREIGQIYVPAVNWALMWGCIALVLGFRNSSNLAAAYGIAVTSTMAITTILFFFVAVRRWKWNIRWALLLCGLFLVIDLAFFGANAIKIAHGGWFPLAVAAFVFTLMSTWKSGRKLLSDRLRNVMVPLPRFVADLEKNPPQRVPGTAIFMHSNPGSVPRALLHNLKHNKILHEKNIILTVVTEEVPRVTEEERVETEPIGNSFYRVVIRYGFMEDPDVPEVLRRIKKPGLCCDPMEVTYFLSHETLIASRHVPGMALWRERLFARMSKNAQSATTFFGLPPNRVVELGTQVEL